VTKTETAASDVLHAVRGLAAAVAEAHPVHDAALVATLCMLVRADAELAIVIRRLLSVAGIVEAAD
jgi:hypothetical protein